jgi:hypothetical protein
MLLYGTSSQLRSGGGGAIQTSGYDGSQFSTDGESSDDATTLSKRASIIGSKYPSMTAKVSKTVFPNGILILHKITEIY